MLVPEVLLKAHNLAFLGILYYSLLHPYCACTMLLLLQTTAAATAAIASGIGQPYLLVMYTYILLSLAVAAPWSCKQLGASPAVKHGVLAAFHLQEVLLALYGIVVRPSLAHFQGPANALVGARWKVFAWMGWRNCMLQVGGIVGQRPWRFSCLQELYDA